MDLMAATLHLRMRSAPVLDWPRIGRYLRFRGEFLVVKPREEASGVPARTDGRRQLLLYLDPELIKELKRMALDSDQPAYEVAEEAIREFLRSRKRQK